MVPSEENVQLWPSPPTLDKQELFVGTCVWSGMQGEALALPATLGLQEAMKADFEQRGHKAVL